jgi:serine/threonine protein kinase
MLQLCGNVLNRLQCVQYNILIDRRGNAHVTDFGLSEILAECDNLQPDAHHPGSVRWAAPELMNLLADEEAGKPTPCSDVYSFGSVALEVPLLTLRFISIVLNYDPGTIRGTTLSLARRPTSCNGRQIQRRATDCSKQLDRQTIRTLSSGMLVKTSRETNGRPHSELCSKWTATIDIYFTLRFLLSCSTCCMMNSTVFIYLDHPTDDHSCTLAYTKVKTRQ